MFNLSKLIQQTWKRARPPETIQMPDTSKPISGCITIKNSKVRPSEVRKLLEKQMPREVSKELLDMIVKYSAYKNIYNKKNNE